MTGTREKGLSATALKVLAMASMFLDHSFIALNGWPGYWMHILGRLAFPIYCFLLVEGFFHTHSRKAYALRLVLFGIISELPFDLLAARKWFYPGHQNVMFTLALGVGAMAFAQKAREKQCPRENLAGVFACIAGATLLNVDYGHAGVLTILLFWATREMGQKGKLFQLAGLLFINYALLGRYETMVGGLLIRPQVAAVLALPLIWLYNGRPGKGGKAFRMAAYWFYPVHLLVLGLLARAV